MVSFTCRSGHRPRVSNQDDLLVGNETSTGKKLKSNHGPILTRPGFAGRGPGSEDFPSPFILIILLQKHRGRFSVFAIDSGASSRGDSSATRLWTHSIVDYSRNPLSRVALSLRERQAELQRNKCTTKICPSQTESANQSDMSKPIPFPDRARQKTRPHSPSPPAIF
jgi:hypothetical protein